VHSKALFQGAAQVRLEQLEHLLVRDHALFFNEWIFAEHRVGGFLALPQFVGALCELQKRPLNRGRGRVVSLFSVCVCVGGLNNCSRLSGGEVGRILGGFTALMKVKIWSIMRSSVSSPASIMALRRSLGPSRGIPAALLARLD
jgi:hypothetical protein